jgi:hypothetical protein
MHASKEKRTIVDRSLPWWLRAIFLFIAIQTFDFALILFRPDLITSLEPWKATPLNAHFIASLYLSTGIGVLLCGLGRNFLQVRIVLIGIGVATSVLLLLTLFRLFFYPGELPGIPYIWLLIYVIDPLLVAFGLWRMRVTEPPTTRVNNTLLSLWMVQTVIFGAVGSLMLLLPAVAVQLWPWGLTEPLAQLYGAFFLALAVVTGLCIGEWRWEGVRATAVMLMSLGILVVLISLLHLDRFKSPLALLVWFVFFAAEALVFGGLLVVRQTRPAVKEAHS